jgi:hypothetical protein
MQLNFNTIFEGLPDSSRIWIYSAGRVLTEDESLMAKEKINDFVNAWAAHGKPLSAQGDLLLNRFIVLAADETVTTASGCSIDSSVHFIKELGNLLRVDFFNRMKLYVLRGKEIVQIHMADLSAYGDDLFFDPMMADLGDFRENWIAPVKNSMLFAQFAG